MKHLLNLVESILLSILVLLVVICLTLLNKNYIKYELNKHDYYNKILNNIKSELNNYDIKDNNIKEDINNYIDSYYIDKEYTNKIDNNEETTIIYNNNIKFIGPYKNVRLYRDIIDIGTILFIIITGTIFIKTKKKHNINIILLLTSIIGIISCFIIYINNNYTNILYNIIIDSYHIYLGLNIILLFIPFYNKIKKYIVKQ